MKLRDEAQFLGSLYTGMDLTANLKATRATVLQALAVYGISVERHFPVLTQPGAPAFDPYLDASQKAEILEDCYQLLLILAETEAQSASGQGVPVEELVRKFIDHLEANAEDFWHVPRLERAAGGQEPGVARKEPGHREKSR